MMIALCGCDLKNSEPVVMSQLFDASKVSKVSIADGSSGKRYELTDDVQIDNFVKQLDMKLQPTKEPDPSTGYWYSTSFLNEQGEVLFRFTMQGVLATNMGYYKMVSDDDQSLARVIEAQLSASEQVAW
ncbi:hypothetical protein [Paenibacillus mucilaginosus]|uniref:hypothetical protein n=1 Tax=Paenibacillus mucilaginosus TaxID=61624 RepID=UPI003D253331